MSLSLNLFLSVWVILPSLFISIHHWYKLLFILHSHVPPQCRLQLKHSAPSLVSLPGPWKQKKQKKHPPFLHGNQQTAIWSCTDHNESVGDLLNYTSSVSWYVAVAALALIRQRSSRGIRLILDRDFTGVSLYIWSIITQTSAFKSFIPRVLASFAHKKHMVFLSSSALMSCWDQ